MSMTIAQAKSELMQIYGALSPNKQIAIDTLVKIEPCEDCISRRAVINAIYANSVWENEYNLTSSRIKKAVEELPSINPQEPKTGHWIEVDINRYSCSNCNHCFSIVPEDNSIKDYKVCPNCGTKMESEE